MSVHEDSTKHWPTYALRAWLTALLGQMERARTELDVRLEHHEKEIARLRAQIQRSDTVLTALREAVGSVDNVLRRTRDSDAESEKGQARNEAREKLEEQDKTKKPAATPQHAKPEKS
jgi:septal ring factor EnvC (AmiA/AmiB activator)